MNFKILIELLILKSMYIELIELDMVLFYEISLDYTSVLKS